MKLCSRCKVEKSNISFYKCKASKSGLKSACKECYKKYRDKNRDKINAHSNNYHHRNTEKIAKKKKVYNEANKSKSKAYYQENKEKIAIKSKAYREQNKIRLAARAKELRDKNKTKLAARRKELRDKNKDEHNKKQREYYHTNIDKSRSYSAKYRINNIDDIKIRKKNNMVKYKDKYKEYNRKRRAFKASVNENYTKTDEATTMRAFGSKCFNCNSNYDLSIDHNLPLSMGHALTTNNAVVLCRPCNSSKGVRLPEEYYNKDQLSELERILSEVDDEAI